MTAKTPDGKEIFRQSKIYMPIPQQMGRGDRMGRGPYEKSGMLRDTSLPPHKTVTEQFNIPFPVEEVKEGDKVKRTILAYDMTVDVELWYMPYDTKEADGTKKISICKTGK